MKNFFEKILRKITYSSMIFWDINFFYTPEKIFEKKIAGTLNFRNKITGEKKEIELDVDQYQWFNDDKKLWEEYFFDEMKKSTQKQSPPEK